MSDLYKAAKQALEVLESLQGGCTDSNDGTVEAITVWCPEVIDALRAALAQQAEPVAWRYKGMIGMPWSLSDDGYYVSCKRDNGYMVEPLYTHPPRREWVPLTDREVDQIAGNAVDAWECARAIEAALKEKNHG